MSVKSLFRPGSQKSPRRIHQPIARVSSRMRTLSVFICLLMTPILLLFPVTAAHAQNNPPYAPNNPTPADGASVTWEFGEEGPYINLSWSGGDPDEGDTVTYDVLVDFGRMGFETIEYNISTTSCTLSPVEEGTTYPWKVVARDSAGAQTEGPVWHFRVTTPPYTPSNPRPADGATGVLIGTDGGGNYVTLSWSGGDPDEGDTVTYDVYLVGDPDQKIADNISTTNCRLSPVEQGTTYAWYVIARDSASAETYGPIWEFTTGGLNNPPYAPSSPNPTNGATGVPIEAGEGFCYVTLSWSGGDPDEGDIVTYDVIIDSGGPSEKVADNISITSCKMILAGGIEKGTTYTWYVIARDSVGVETPGPVWQFTTTTGNIAPYIPNNPSPANCAIWVPLESSEGGNYVTLSWVGGDPDEGDTVIYDIFVDTGEGFVKAADGIVVIPHQMTGAQEWTTHNWKVVARDSAGAEAQGPVWRFTTATTNINISPPPIAGGLDYTAGLKSNGIVWAWGANWTGQLGDGTQDERHTPVQVSNLGSVIAIAGGYFHSLALKSDGTVWAWGDNQHGQLGDGTYFDKTTPVQVSNLGNVIAIAGGVRHSLALKSDGTVWAWGDNQHGQLGDGTTNERLTPVQVSNLSNVTAIVGRYWHSLALKSDGTVWAWGANEEGQLGDGTQDDRLTPVQVSNLGNVIAIAGGDSHSIALKSDGIVWAWGANWYGQLGDGTTNNRLTPVQISNLSNVIAIAGGDYHSIALKSDGTVWAWGDNWNGQLGDGTQDERHTPVQASNLSNVIAIAGGYYHSLALKSNGTVWAWGFNQYGQLGDGTTEGRLVPVQVLGSGGEGFLNLLSENNPPYAPANPNPADGATDVPIEEIPDGGLYAVTLSWSGGDPDAGDTVTYDVYFGTSTENLVEVADSISETTYQMDVAQGTTYFWQIIARDSAGVETWGPSWQFTTWASDLVVTDIIWEPAVDIGAGQQVTFTATIQNNGDVQVVDAFQVDFRIDGESIGSQPVGGIIEVGGSVQVSHTWTAQFGEHTIEVAADSTGALNESDENNNTLSKTLPAIVDITPPELVSTEPADGAVVSGATQIVIVLMDLHGTVDDAAVIASIAVTDGNNQPVSGTVAESNDQFTFTPDVSPMPDDTYQVTFTAQDIAGNSQAHTLSFTVNSPPNTPGNPNPAHEAIKVPLTNGSATLSWVGGDPNIGDTVVYDLYFGTTPEGLVKVAYSIDETSYQKDGLAQGTTYLWQIIARDNWGMETQGPVWQFTTWASDLVVTDIIWDPAADIGAGQQVTFTATVQNSGTGPAVDPFLVDFRIDGISIGSQLVAQIIDTGESIQVIQTWAAQVGQHTIEVLADSTGFVTEENEDNNTLSQALPGILDVAPPEVVSTSPANGAMVSEVTQIVIVLVDLHGTVDDAAVIASIAVTNGNNQPVSGAVAESNDQFTFTPDISPMPDDTYQVSFTARDIAGNSQAQGFSFTVDTVPPPVPVINPVESPTHNPNQTITGSKEAYAAILLAGQVVVGNTPGTTWQHTVSLQSGANQFAFSTRDRAGNESDTVTVEIVFDDIPPPAVDTLTVNGEGDGTTVALDWTGYDESLHGDIASYRIYAETSEFTDVTGLTPNATVSAGTFTYTVGNLVEGTTYWFAVVAVDLMNNALTTVTSLPGVPTDAAPPEEVTNLRVTASLENSLDFAWNHSLNTRGDLAGYKAYFNNPPEGTVLPPTQNTYGQAGLNPSSAYPFRVTAFDTHGNESPGVTITGYTLLDNPANVSVTPQGGYVNISWDPVTPSGYVNYYAVYASTTDYSTVNGMTPRVTAYSTSAKVAGLTNNVTYYLAVTAVNLSDGERKEVTTVSATPVPDDEGPEITDVKVDGEPLVDGQTIRKPATFTLNASDPSGVSRVEFSFDGALVRTDYNGFPYYDCYWNIVGVEDGGHALAIVAHDTLGNTTTVNYNLNVALDPPQAPTIAQPQDGAVTNQEGITVSGTAERYTEVILYKDGAQVAGPVPVDIIGRFSIDVTLAEGENRIQAAAQNRAGMGPLSSEVLVTLDTTLPPSPTHVSAQSRQAGVIRLTWRAPANTSVKGYNLYRAQTSFTTIGEAEKVNVVPFAPTTFDDMPADDGTYYYRVTTVSLADNESELSNEASALSDRIMPRAISIEYDPQGNYDSVTGRMAPGTVDVTLTVSEPLQSIPFFSITPEGGFPFSIDLIKQSDLVYAGFFVIGETTPIGTAYAVFSGRDMVGNRGTEIDEGGSILIDTEGPAVSAIAIYPADPILNNETDPVTVAVRIGLTDAMKPGVEPQLSYLLSAAGREPFPVEGLAQVAPQGGEAQAWEGSFILPGDAGLAEVETFGFIYQGMDDLENVSEAILCPNLFQVYQGDLPPLAPPDGLKGVSLPEGRIKLTWNVVEGAAGYQLYRKAPDEADLTEYEMLGAVLEYIDEPALEGLYTYAVASIRQENEQEAISGMSDTVEVASDATVPGPPQNLSLGLVPQGIRAIWEAPPYTEPIAYSLYRADLPEITSVEGLTPIETGIEETEAIDSNPSPSDHAYVVTAVDEAGNESAPSNSFYLNFDLLPVSGLHVVQEDTDSPVITWTHPGGDIAGYDVYLGPEGTEAKLNTDLLTDMSYTDTGYAGDERRYTVVAVDDFGHESVGRSIILPVLSATLAEGSMLRRGIMNVLEYHVTNLSLSMVNNVLLKVSVEGRDHISESFSLQPQTSDLVHVVVGGYDDLPDLSSLTTTIQVTPNEGEEVEIIRSGQIEVGEGMLVLGILNEEFIRGGAGSVRFTLENTGQEEIEITTARNTGTLASDEITFYLMDLDDNVLSSVSFVQALGEGVVTLPNGNTVARIPAGAAFTSGPMDIPVPATAPDDVVVQLVISSLYYHQGKADQVKMDGLSTSHEIALIDTTYYGEVTSIAPESSTGDQPIVITGQAMERATGLPMPEVHLKLVITVNGFDRNYEIFTDTQGAFSFDFIPLEGESGIYRVRATHPEILDTPVQGEFTINRVSISPRIIDLSIPVNYEKKITIWVSTGEGTEANNLGLVYEEADQPDGVFPEGVHVSLGDPIPFLGSGQTQALDFTIWADNTADEMGYLVLKVASDESGPDAWGKVFINTHFSEALPALFFTPDHVETGVAHDDTAIETIVLENKGLADLEEVSISLIESEGIPAPDWVYLNTPSQLGTIAVGETRKVDIAFSPTTSVSDGVYTFFLRVVSANYQTTDIYLYASVTQSGIGNVLFKVSDIYTGTLDENDEIIQGLSGAKIEVQNEEVLTIEETKITDDLGEAYFADLPAGRYKCRVTAQNHQQYIGRFWIKPDVTVNQEVFLNYDLVTVEWEIIEIPIEDRYEIVLRATYETDVPAPVLVPEPASVHLPPMNPGDVFSGEFDLINYGLIRADDLTYTVPGARMGFKFELLFMPETIEAKDSVTIPYRVTCLQSPGEGGGTGGAVCALFSERARIDYGFVCAKGEWIHSSTYFYWTYDNGECRLTEVVGYVPPSDPRDREGGPMEGGGTSSPSPPPESIEGVKCFIPLERKECYFDKCLSAQEETVQNTGQGSSVNTVLREYNHDHVDLTVKVPGGFIEVKRWFYGDGWHWDHAQNNLTFNLDSLGKYIESIDKGDINYWGSPISVHDDTYRITEMDDGYLWRDKHGKRKEFDQNGRETSYGTANGVVGKLLYEPGNGGNVIGIADRNNTQVIWFEYNGDGFLSTAYDIENRRVEYAYTDGRLTKVTDFLNNEIFYEYDAKGRIRKLIDAAGKVTNIFYDGYGNVESILDIQGKGYFFGFDYDEAKEELYAFIRTPSGMTKQVRYDKEGEANRVVINGRIVKKIERDRSDLIITDEKGYRTRKEYDEWENLTRVIYPDNSVVTYEYEHTFNRRTREVDERGIVTTYEYDDAGNMTRKVEAVGTPDERTTEYTYDGDGNQLTVKIVGDADTDEAITTFEYDANGNMTSMTDPEGNITRFTSHDIMGNVLTMEDTRGKLWTYEYDLAGRLKTSTDPLNNITQFFYDEVGNKIREVDAEGRERTFEYDENNNLTKITDSAGNATLLEYNADGRLIKQTDPEGKMVRYEYDLEGQITKTIDGNGNEIIREYASGSSCPTCPGGGGAHQPSKIIFPTFAKEFTYNLRGRKVEERDVLSPMETYTEQFAYDSSGNLVSRTDKEGKTTAYEYDDLNRLTKVIDPLGSETEYTYDDRDNLISLKDANANATGFEYDRNKRLVKEIRPMGEETAYQYDEVGNLIQKIDAKNQKTEYEYDDSGRLFETRYFSASDHSTPVKTVTFTYDKVGNLMTYGDGVTSATYGYDDAYRKISESLNYGPFEKTYAYTYYKNGMKASFMEPGGVTYDYTYDANNQLTGIQIPGKGSITYPSYTWYQPNSMTLPGGSTKQFTYDPLMRIKSITAKDPGQNTLMNYQYTYDKMNNIVNKDTEHGVYPYTYDDLYRLTNAESPTLSAESYTYDPVGNRLTAADVNGDWSYNDNNELLSYNDVSFEYDANGNMTKKTAGADVTNYIYNVENRLIKVEDGTGMVIAEYNYDPFGRRLWKEVGGVRTYFLYSDEGLIAEFDSSGQEIKTYGYSLSSAWTTDPLFMKEGDNYYFYHNDHLGTPQKVTSVNGAVAWSAKYTSFGKAQVEVETVVNNLRFPGQYYDQETGLHYNYFRDYKPELGRYIQPDPIGEIPDGVSQDAPNHLYIYVGNNPVNWIDPWGEVACNYSITGKRISCIYKDPITCGDLLISCYAESGNNNPNDQCTKRVGPIPVGRWKIAVPHASRRARLSEYPGTNTCKPKRTRLQIHGWGTTTGCIAVKANTCADTIMDALRREGGGYLEVTL